MPFEIDEKLVVAVASSALFDLDEADRVFREEGPKAYRKYQREHESVVLNPGVAFPLIRRLLSISGPEEDHLVEVVLLSRNDSDTGLRVFKSIEHHRLPISRAAFVAGRNPFVYMDAFNAALFLSANESDVEMAVKRGLPAGRVFPTDFVDDVEEPELRIAFDFDGIMAGDSAEAVNKKEGLEQFHAKEHDRASIPMEVGPLHRFVKEIASLQSREWERKEKDPDYEPRIRVAIVTARDAPAHERVVTSLRDWGIQVDETFFLGGIDKSRILEVFKPHIFFDDQLAHVERTARVAPSVHVPFGIANEPSEADMIEALREDEERSRAEDQHGP